MSWGPQSSQDSLPSCLVLLTPDYNLGALRGSLVSAGFVAMVQVETCGPSARRAALTQPSDIVVLDATLIGPPSIARRWSRELQATYPERGLLVLDPSQRAPQLPEFAVLQGVLTPEVITSVIVAVHGTRWRRAFQRPSKWDDTDFHRRLWDVVEHLRIDFPRDRLPWGEPAFAAQVIAVTPGRPELDVTRGWIGHEAIAQELMDHPNLYPVRVPFALAQLSGAAFDPLVAHAERIVAKIDGHELAALPAHQVSALIEEFMELGFRAYVDD